MIRLPNILRLAAIWRAMLMGVVAVALMFATPCIEFDAQGVAGSQIVSDVDQSGQSDAPVKMAVHCAHCSHHQATRAEAATAPSRAILEAAVVRFWSDARLDSTTPSPLPRPPRA